MMKLNKNIKNEIIEYINLIESNELLKHLLNIIRMAYRQYKNGKWGA